ncbi:VPLPA-CTERM sorting domain-containing protein [Sedimentitalea nanhaiensis]|uniref:VPLPA-CTERM protein sorting domain-containing protein n=1 Tax=Sedimentitalea nanhaiensis TaxID=999627 RepID=A0A1I6Y8D0_9RHOB|nr:VPLPA-CTERM sorting domain-containing protein [Sedimentitalea nanhaiensis]SFT46647.1 hypothetical protein SAMN05216236_10298 [Sedimentitalea nanhaiensis]
MQKLFTSLLAIAAATGSHAGTVVVPYTGSFDEAAIVAEGGFPAGDFDTLGGAEDVGLFNLVAGTNTFSGSVYSANDPADTFLIAIAEGMQIVGASIAWATNLPGIEYDFLSPSPAGFLQQNTFGAEAPYWTLEESSITPTVFRLDGLEATKVGNTFDVAPSSYDAPDFMRGAGIYSSLLDATGTCGQIYVAADPGVNTQCASGLSYTLSFQVEPTISAVPLPAAGSLLVFALAGFGAAGLRRRKAA